MKEILPQPPANVKEQFEKYIVPTYGRFDLVLTRGEGNHVWDTNGKRYLDLGGGIAVNCLGHSNAEIARTLADQAKTLGHVSNLYYSPAQGQLAQKLVQLIAPGKCFFSNSGAEANEGLYKLARRFGDREGRFEIITAKNSFHGRTLAGIAATGQDKVKAGFGPMTPGFVHVPYNDLQAVEDTISPATIAVLIECIQGEGGLTQASPEYLMGLRKLCDENGMLLMLDEIQAGHFRTGKFQSWQTVLDEVEGAADFQPDAVSMAKSLGGGLPVGAIWVRERHASLLGAGSHGTTFGGNSFVCSVALKILEIIERDHLVKKIRMLSEYFQNEIIRLAKECPSVVTDCKGTGLMMGLEINAESGAFKASDATPSIQVANALQQNGLLMVPAGPKVIRLLPAYTLSKSEAEEAVKILKTTIQTFAE